MAASIEGIVMRPLMNALNDALRTVPLPPSDPKEKTTFGVTHYTCLPSKSKPAEYECKKGFDESHQDGRYNINLVTRLAIQDKNKTLRIIWADDALKEVNPEYMKRRYWACYDTPKGLECKKGQFDSVLEEGKVKYISVPTLMPNHEWYIKQRWSRARIVDTYTDWQIHSSDLNNTNSKS